MKLEEWANMKPCHLNRHEYKMFRSLCDMINYQLRGKQAPQTPTKETLENISPDNGENFTEPQASVENFTETT